MGEELREARGGCGGAGGAEAPGGAESTLNLMPSRQMAHKTLRLRRHNLEQMEAGQEAGAGAGETTDAIVRELEQRSLMLEDNPAAEQLRREALRELPEGLTLKRSVRAALSASVRHRRRQGARPLSLYKRVKYSASFAWRRGWARAREAAFALEVWHGTISAIEGQFGSGVGSYFRMVRRLLLLDAALAALLLLCTVLPQALHAPPAPSAAAWLTGEDSLLFFGHYSSGWVLGGRYYMPFAYLLTALAAAAALCAWLCYSTAASYRRHFIVSGGAQSLVFANKLFCGWDFGITAPRAAALNARQLHNEFTELLRSADSARRPVGLMVRLGRRATNALVTVLVLGVVGGALAGLHALLPREHLELPRSLLITAAVALCPALLHAAARVEWRGARGRVYVTLARAWLLHSGLLLLLLVYWSRSGTECWESRFAAEAYRLVLLDSVVCLLVLPAVQILRAFLHKVSAAAGAGARGSRERAAPQFSLAAHSLTLLYNQALVWFGLLFCPLLAAVVALKLLLLFYVQRACLLHACQPPRKVWRAPQTQTLLSALVTLSLAAALFALGSLFLRMPSTDCGPFREYDYVYMVVSEGLLQLRARPSLRAALSWLTRPAVIAFLLLLLCVAVYYMRGVARAQRSTVRLLRRMLALQATDKDFLLAAIHRVSNGEWLYSRRGSAETGAGAAGEGHTRRYLREVRRPSNACFQLEGARPTPPPPPPPARAPRTRAAAAAAEDGDSDTSFSWRAAAASE